MTNEELDQEQEDKTSPAPGSESEESEDVDNLLADFKDDSQEDDPLIKLGKKVDSLEKGIRKYISKKEAESKSKPTEDKKIETQETQVSPVIKNLYFKSNPEAELIWDEVQKEAKLLGKDPFELYESSSYLKGEAKARAEQKKVEEESKKKINKPSTDVDFSKNIGNVKPEEVDKLPKGQKMAWIEAQAKKEKESIE